MNGSSEDENFLQLIPGFVVFDNIIPELVYSLNMSGPLIVLYDEHLSKLL